MRIYLSGIMRGLPDNNFAEFDRVAGMLRKDGHDVLSPADSTRGGFGLTDRFGFLRHDTQLVLISNAVVVMPGWENSPGARFEVAEAWMVGIPTLLFKENYKAQYILEPLTETGLFIPREEQYLKRIPLVGMSGFAGAGKDEVARTLVEGGFTRVAFADPLKKIATDIGWNGEKDDTGRKLLQDLGISLREVIEPAVWVSAAEHTIERLLAPVVITDVRFPNELTMIRRRKGQIVRVVRPGVGAVNDHISEHAIGDADADIIFHNDCSLAELPEKVRTELLPLVTPSFEGLLA